MFNSVAIVGSGAIGTYYGAKLALSGVNVRFLMRGDLAHVQRHGIRLVEKNVTHELRPAAAYASTREIGPVDLVIVTLKTTSNRELGALVPPLLHRDSVALTLQNGLGNEEALAAVAGRERTIGGLCFIAANRTGPGEVTCFEPGSMAIGEIEGPATHRTREAAAMFARAGVACVADNSLLQARWSKLIWNIPFNGLSIAAGGITTDVILRSPELAGRVRRLMRETALAARAQGFSISDEFVEYQITRTPGIGAYRPSSLVDFIAGREIELEAIWGEPLRRGQAAGVAMPELAQLYAELKAANDSLQAR
jgi:2-dehydropantoate 2-reductase